MKIFLQFSLYLQAYIFLNLFFNKTKQNLKYFEAGQSQLQFRLTFAIKFINYHRSLIIAPYNQSHIPISIRPPPSQYT